MRRKRKESNVLRSIVYLPADNIADYNTALFFFFFFSLWRFFDAETFFILAAS